MRNEHAQLRSRREGDERMALKILTAAADLLDGKDNLEIHTTQNGREPIYLTILYFSLDN
jgi:hypothetical protein